MNILKSFIFIFYIYLNIVSKFKNQKLAKMSINHQDDEISSKGNKE